ncbi:hypothetical protein ACVLV4_000431 [Rathayibacter agropyri]
MDKNTPEQAIDTLARITEARDVFTSKRNKAAAKVAVEMVTGTFNRTELLCITYWHTIVELLDEALTQLPLEVEDTQLALRQWTRRIAPDRAETLGWERTSADDYFDARKWADNNGGVALLDAATEEANRVVRAATFGSDTYVR